MVSGYSTSTGISRVDGLSTDTPVLGIHKFGLMFFIEVIAAIVNLMLGF